MSISISSLAWALRLLITKKRSKPFVLKGALTGPPDGDRAGCAFGRRPGRGRLGRYSTKRCKCSYPFALVSRNTITPSSRMIKMTSSASGRKTDLHETLWPRVPQRWTCGCLCNQRKGLFRVGRISCDCPFLAKVMNERDSLVETHFSRASCKGRLDDFNIEFYQLAAARRAACLLSNRSYRSTINHNGQTGK
ncbi:hypothetical protein EVAR_103407_1 [Eumeta japonica]|uniref:Uncharacterized protein n=1 Tax=Eumeta variegata TaxID=151549 RepID=A0A4C1YWW7_EUMVA|nr:hypothetical protein EVAR_103407_1 [Eumeta japonica]